jgi:Ulp1 family protease
MDVTAQDKDTEILLAEVLHLVLTDDMDEVFEVSSPNNKSKNIENKNILFVSPFIGGQHINEAAVDLHLCDYPPKEKLSNAELTQIQMAACSPRVSRVAFVEGDLEKCDEGNYINDNIVDFWMKWLTRNEPLVGSQVHMFSTHFYTKLREEGVKGVSRWTTTHNIDIFKKKIVFVPIHKDLYWSLSVVVNPGTINWHNCDRRVVLDIIPCIVSLDPMKDYHNRKVVAQKVIEWFNFEWKERKSVSDNLFNSMSCPIVTPRGNYFDLLLD